MTIVVTLVVIVILYGGTHLEAALSSTFEANDNLENGTEEVKRIRAFIVTLFGAALILIGLKKGVD